MDNPFSTQIDYLNSNKQIRGRFAPSPSGPLHLGSLLSAVGSYLHAKSHDGLWFVRIEDIDTTRVHPHAKELILESLVAFGLHWDQDDLSQLASQPSGDVGISHGTLSGITQGAATQGVTTQTERLHRYEQVLNYLQAKQLVYGCDCTRKQIKLMPNGYNGHCQHRGLSLDDKTHAVRFTPEFTVKGFTDLHFGEQPSLHEQVLENSQLKNEHYIIKRRDGLFSYQLVVVVDDIDQGITHIVRGADIMPLTSRQISLYKTFGAPAPKFLHLPLLSAKPGFKLSKQNHAPEINIKKPQIELVKVLNYLALPVENEKNLVSASVSEILNWAIENVDFSKLSQRSEIII